MTLQEGDIVRSGDFKALISSNLKTFQSIQKEIIVAAKTADYNKTTAIETFNLNSGSINDKTYVTGDFSSVDTTNTTSAYNPDNQVGFTGTAKEFYSGYGSINNSGTNTTAGAGGNVSNPDLAFDNNDITCADEDRPTGDGAADYYVGRTFAARYILGVRVYASFVTASAASRTVYLETYNGGSWDIQYSETWSATSQLWNRYFYLNATVQGVRVRFHSNASDTGNDVHLYWYTINIYTTFDNGIVQTNTIVTAPSAIKGVYISENKKISGTASITVDVSTDGGTSWCVKNASTNTFINTSNFTGSQLRLRFNLAGSSTTNYIELIGYGVLVIW
jgi:hypothetical protein